MELIAESEALPVPRHFTTRSGFGIADDFFRGLAVKLVHSRTTKAGGLTEGGQFHQVVFGYYFHWLASLAPGGQTTDDDERVEAFFPQQVRHPGAGRFARSSTVQIDILVAGKIFDFFLKIVGLDADGILDARGSRVIVAVAADVNDLHPVGIFGGQSTCQYLDLNPRHDAVGLVLAVLHEAIDTISQKRHYDHNFHGQPGRVKASQGSGQKITGNISYRQVGQGVEGSASQIKTQELPEA